MEVLTLHESVPGHHLQISLAQEMENVPEFRKYEGSTRLSPRAGRSIASGLATKWASTRTPTRSSASSRFDMWRACRLVVDTGIHSKGWTRQQAIDYLMANAGQGRTRSHGGGGPLHCIARPGPGLQDRPVEIPRDPRRRLRSELGDEFDLRAFHDALLANGSLPLPVLDHR